MANRIIDAAAETQTVEIVNTSSVTEPLLTVGPVKVGTFARISFWVSNLSTDALFSIYRGTDLTADPLLFVGAPNNALIVDDSPVSEYTLAYRGDQSFSVTATLSVDQIA